MTTYYNYDHGIPCSNPDCKSFGHPHPNCRCGANARPHDEGEYAHGGEVHYCSLNRPHDEACEHYAEGGEVEANHEFATNPDLATDHAVVAHGLLHLLTKTGRSKSEDPTRVAQDHLDHFRRGRKILQRHSDHLFEHKKEHEIHEEPKATEALGTHLEDLKLEPHKMLEVGGTLNDTLPDHHGVIAAKAAAASNYFSAIKPQPHQAAPLDPPLPPSKGAEADYRRQLAIAENPSLVFQDVKEGLLRPQDLKTLQTLYPKLSQKIINQATESLINARTDGKWIPYKQKQSLSRLLGQPLDYTFTPAATMAIIQSSSTQDPSPQAPSKKGKTGPTAQTQKTLEKTDQLYETELDHLQMDHDH